MSICVIGGVLEKPVADNRLFIIKWADELDTGIGRNIPVNDQIESSVWAIDSGSPTANVIISETGFDAASSTTWATIDAGIADDVVWINNTIVTAGACVGGKNTPSQRITRQIRLRVKDC